MSSIRRSSLTSITLGLPTVIGGYLSFASLEEAAGQCLECPLEPCIRARRYGAGRPVLLLRWRLGPARFGSYDDATVQAGCHGPASEAVTAVTDYSLSNPLFFGRRAIDAQSPKRWPPTTALLKKLHSLPSSIRRIIQPRRWRVLAFSAGRDGRLLEHDDLERWRGGWALPWHRADLGFFGAHALSRCAQAPRMDSCGPLLATHFFLDKQKGEKTVKIK